jgi:hypothetical protein
LQGIGEVKWGILGIFPGIIPIGGIFQISQGVKEQHERIKGFITQIATDDDSSPCSCIRGDSSPPSQVQVGGNSKLEKIQGYMEMSDY